MLPIKIAGLGWYLPERCVTNAELEEQLGIPADWIKRVTGVQERRYVTNETAVSMAASAARMALEAAALHVNDLDAIIGASTAPHQTIPCTAALLQRELNAPEGASACFDLNATCLSFLFALQTAAHLIAAGVYRTVLICSSELASRSLNPTDLDATEGVLFGEDGDDLTEVCIPEHSPGWHPTQIEVFP